MPVILGWHLGNWDRRVPSSRPVKILSQKKQNKQTKTDDSQSLIHLTLNISWAYIVSLHILRCCTRSFGTIQIPTVKNLNLQVKSFNLTSLCLLKLLGLGNRIFINKAGPEFQIPKFLAVNVSRKNIQNACVCTCVHTCTYVTHSHTHRRELSGRTTLGLDS